MTLSNNQKLLIVLGVLIAAGGGGYGVYKMSATMEKGLKNNPHLAALFAKYEAKWGLPRNFLAAIGWRESRYKPGIIRGITKSPVGAVGLMQFMPATAKEYGIDPLNVEQSIDAAGKYLKKMFSKYKHWPDAIASYNWGPGNVDRWIKNGRVKNKMPQETSGYIVEVMRNVGLW